MSIERKPGRLAQKLLLTPIRAYIERRSHVVIERNDTLDMEPPYLVLSNHVNNWDPLFINCYVNEPICFVAAAPLFRTPLLRRVLDYTGAISKTKFKNDTSTIRSMLKAKKHRRVIGIFPEGNRTWDGRTEPLVYSTAKLVKLLNIPVVIVTIRGGYLSHPRWADKHRKGVLSLSFEKKWDAGELAQESVEVIHQKLTDALKYNEIEWQKKRPTKYVGEGLAHYLERLLFLCPHCEAPGTLRSDGDQFQCKPCGYTVRYTANGTFEPVHLPLRFPTVHEWNDWQLDHFRHSYGREGWESIWSGALVDPVKVYISEDESHPFTAFGEGQLRWNDGELHFEPGRTGQPLHLPLRKLEGVNIHFHNKLDFFYDNRLYRFVFYEPRSSAFKWLTLIQTAQKHAPEVPE